MCMSDKTHGPVEWQEFGAASIDGVGLVGDGAYVRGNDRLAAVYGFVTGAGIVDMVIRVAIQGGLIYLILGVFVWWAGRDSGDSNS